MSTVMSTQIVHLFSRSKGQTLEAHGAYDLALGSSSKNNVSML